MLEASLVVKEHMQRHPLSPFLSLSNGATPLASPFVHNCIATAAQGMLRITVKCRSPASTCAVAMATWAGSSC